VIGLIATILSKDVKNSDVKKDAEILNNKTQDLQEVI